MRRELLGRPLLLVAIGAGSAWAGLLHPLCWLVAALFFALLPGLRPKLWIVLGCAIALIRPVVVPKPIEQARTYRGEVVVWEMPRVGRFGQSATVQTTLGPAVARFDEGVSLGIGDRLRVDTTIEPPPPSVGRLPTMVGLIGSMRIDGRPVVVRKGIHLWHLGNTLRDAFTDFSARTMDRSSSAIANALCFNQDADLEDETKDQLRRSGTIHIISTSGMHVALVTAVLVALASRLPLPRWSQLALVLLVVLFYVTAAGLRAPAFRSFLMALVVLPAYLLKSEADGLAALAFAFLLEVLVWPLHLLDIGFQLSYAILGGLILFGGLRPMAEPASVLDRWRDGLRAGLQSGFVATMAASPLVAYYFGSLSFVAPIANLAVAPWVGPIVGGSLLAFLLQWVPTVPEFLIHQVVDPASSLLSWSVHVTGSPWWVATSVPPFSGWWVALFYLIAFGLWRPSARPA